MENPRPEKVAVVEEVRQKLGDADSVILTEYRGLTVPQIAELRKALREAGGEYKIYKNTLARFAARDLGLDLDELLVGPTAIAFTSSTSEPAGDPALVAKALRSYAKTNDNLVIKGGMLGDKMLTAAEVEALAQIAPREELLARLAGGLAAPMQQFAALLAALPQNLAYGLQALIDQGGAPGAGSGDDAQEESDDDAGDAQAESGDDAQAVAPYGEGSAAPLPDDSAPDGFTIKGNADSMLYHTPDSAFYGRTIAEAWFSSVEAAEAAGFSAPGGSGAAKNEDKDEEDSNEAGSTADPEDSAPSADSDDGESKEESK